MLILGLGCNIGERLTYLRTALQALRLIKELTIIQVSPVYQSLALLLEDAPEAWSKPFLNCAVSCETTLTPEQLLNKLQAIEISMGRGNHAKWSPRVIDIDILVWDDLYLQTANLKIPHVELIKRPFAMWPVADLAPNWCYCVPNTPWSGKPACEIVQPWGSRFTGQAPLSTQQITQRIDTPIIMGILNLTPDSFSDGGKYVAVDKALQQAEDLFAAGADIIDIGAESTRPNAQPVPAAIEWQRLQPVLVGLSKISAKISVDTRNPEVAAKALTYDIGFLNDVTGFTNPQMLKIAKAATVQLIFMHNLGVPPQKTMLEHDVVAGILQWVTQRLEVFDKFAITNDRLIFDVGLGFGKTAAQSLHIIKNIASFTNLALPVLVGHSRKSYLALLTPKPAIERDLETAIISNYLANNKVAYLRVHNVAMNVQALKINAALN